MDAIRAEQYTVGQWMDVWFENCAKIKVRPSSHKTYRGYIDNHIKPSIGKIPLSKLSSLDLQKLYDGLWLMWWDAAAPSEAYTSCFQNLAMNGGTIVYMGGAAVLETAAHNGSFAIAFGDGYAQKDAVMADFQGLSGK